MITLEPHRKHLLFEYKATMGYLRFDNINFNDKLLRLRYQEKSQLVPAVIWKMLPLLRWIW